MNSCLRLRHTQNQGPSPTCLTFSTPPQTPLGGFPAKGSDAQVSPTTGPRGCQLDWLEDIQLGFSVSYVALQKSVNSEQYRLGGDCTTQGTSAPFVFLRGLKPSARGLGWG